MKSLEEFNIVLKRADDYLNTMVREKRANKEDCENVKMLFDNINTIVRNLSIPLFNGSFESKCSVKVHKTGEHCPEKVTKELNGYPVCDKCYDNWEQLRNIV